MSVGGSDRAPFRRQQSGIAYGSDDGEHQANPSSIVAKFEASAGDGDRFDATLPPLELPGFGSRREDCGDEIPRFCCDCGACSMAGRCCRSWTCPRCWKGADRLRATTAASKLEALRRYREASEGPGWRGWKMHHLVLSPPDGYAMDADEPLDRTFDLLKEVLDELGADTGVLIYHPFRGEDGDDRGFWKDVLPDGESPTFEEWRDQEPVKFSPHFHAVVLSKNVDTAHVVGAVEEQTGWVINRITKGGDDGESNVSIYDLHDLARSITYCMSHQGVDGGRAQYRYFGEVANFAAAESIRREVDAAVRSVSVRTLGLPYDSVACSIERDITVTKTIQVPAEQVDLAAAAGAGPAEPEMEEVEIEEETHGRCDGRLLEIRNAPAFLDDADWMDRAIHADQLADAWAKWRDRIDDDPEETPRPPDD